MPPRKAERTTIAEKIAEDMRIGNHHVGVCNWSLQPKGADDLVTQVKSLGLNYVQLAMEPLVTADDTRKEVELRHLHQSRLHFCAGMISFPGEDYSSIDAIRRTGGYVPDNLWPLRKKMSIDAACLAKQMGIPMVSTHVGFVPAAGEKGYAEIISRVRSVADEFGHQGLVLLIETGQEPAGELLAFLNDLNRRNVAINFDPANMILYGAGDPVAAVGTLGKHIRHVHIKDATASTKPGVEWGEEVPFGAGAVDVKSFINALTAIDYTGPLIIEREAGTTRADDVRKAIETLQKNVS